MNNVTDESQDEAPRKRQSGKRGKSPSLQERSTAIALAERGATLAEIGKLLDRSPDTIARIVKQAKEDLLGLVPSAVNALALAVQIAALKGDDRPAIRVLQNAGVVEKDAATDGSGVRIQIGIALPGLPGGGAPVAVSSNPAPIVVNRSGELPQAIEGEVVTRAMNG